MIIVYDMITKIHSGGVHMNKRQARIVEIVNHANQISFYDLKKFFPDVADITLRRDLSSLAAGNRILRYHGGVKSVNYQVGTDGDLSYRSAVNMDAKRSIAEAATTFVHPNTTIFIDSGSTCLELCKVFPDIPVLVFTSGINCAMELCKRKNVQLYILGGMVNKETMALSGSTPLSQLKHLNFDISFLGALGFSDHAAFTTGEEEAAILKREVIHHTDKTFVLADSGKFGHPGTFTFCEPADIDYLVTDVNADSATIMKIASDEVNVIIANP